MIYIHDKPCHFLIYKAIFTLPKIKYTAKKSIEKHKESKAFVKTKFKLVRFARRSTHTIQRD